jgi:hypothetical protein
MPSVRFMPSENGEEKLRMLAREPSERQLPELWNMHGTLHLDLGFTEPLRLTCANPVKHALEPLIELMHWVRTGRGNLFSSVLGTSAFGRSNHLYHRWRGAYEAVLLLGLRDSTIGLTKQEHTYIVTVLETDDQPQLEDQQVQIPRETLLALPAILWDDLEALLSLLGIELEPKEISKWQRLRFNPNGEAQTM